MIVHLTVHLAIFVHNYCTVAYTCTLVQMVFAQKLTSCTLVLYENAVLYAVLYDGLSIGIPNVLDFDVHLYT